MIDTRKKLKRRVAFLTIMLAFLSVTLNYTIFAFAYFNQYITKNVDTSLDVNNLFGHLDESLNPTGAWGTDTNPYLINEIEHLRNIYVLQNTYDRELINEETVFQVSTTFGNPIFVGGSSYSELYPMTSIGTEQFPFTSTLRGVQTTNASYFITLPTGEISDTSSIGNLQVTAKTGQADIGLFGNVGPTLAEAGGLSPGDTIGSISTLLLYNIQIYSEAIGAHDPDHNYFVSNPTYNGIYESNHIGILVGHAQYTDIHDISVYYSGENDAPHVKAFDVRAGSSAKYATSGGIIGFFYNIVVDEETEYPVTSNGAPQNIGTGATGLDLGIVYTEDLWTFMEKNTSVGDPAPNDSYNLQDTFGTELYGAGNTTEKYFQIGVFTFAHSKQVRTKDRLARIWATAGSNMWTISTSNTYTASDANLGPAKKYVLTQVTSDHVYASTTTATSSTYHTVTSFTNANYRFMIIYTSGTTNYALMRYGSTAIAQQIDINNFVILESQLKYYTFEVLSSRVANTSYPPYETNWAYKYQTQASMVFSRTANMPNIQYLAYGEEVTVSGVITEAPRPLRIFYSASETPTVSFMATSQTAYPEGVRIIPEGSGSLWGRNTTTKTPYSRYRLQRMYGTSSFLSYYATFSETTGFSATGTLNSGTLFKIYAVRTTPNTSTPSESPTDVNLTRKLYTPTGTTKTYDMSLNTLVYTGTPTSTTMSQKYKYDIQSIESLEWARNDGFAMTQATKALKMADPTSYYYISSRFWGVTQGIPAPSGTGTINVPEGSIGFTVQGTGLVGTTARIFVMVATDPSLDIDQAITISRFGTGDPETGDRTIIGTYLLPPAPGATTADTYPIYITDNGNNYTAYTNFNVLPVAYTFTVDARYTTTYFLEASRGSATFIYLSAERSAAHDNNPTHENDVKFPQLASVDYVFKGIVDPTRIATVGSEEYSSSLTSPYFGMMSNPDNPTGTIEGIDALIIPIVTGFDFQYGIKRFYNPDDHMYTIFIDIAANVDGAGYDPPNTIVQVNTIMDNMNFNFSEWSYLDQVNNAFVYSDYVILRINGYTIDDWTLIT